MTSTPCPECGAEVPCPARDGDFPCGGCGLRFTREGGDVFIYACTAADARAILRSDAEPLFPDLIHRSGN